MIRFNPITITGVANDRTYDTGLSSSQAQPKTLHSVIVQVDEYEGNKLQGWLDTDKVFEIYDYNLDTREEGSTDKAGMSMNRLNEIEVGVKIPVGSQFLIALECGATANNFTGAYRWEKTE